MKAGSTARTILTIIAALLAVAPVVTAQPAASPLGIQGLDQAALSGVRSRSMGGTGVASALDASALFSNPAALGKISAFEIRLGGLFGSTSREQTQEWVPMRPLPGLSVLFEGLAGSVKPPDSLGQAGLPLSAWSRLQKQYDNITPNWKRSSSATQPLSLVAAMPLKLSGIEVVAGLGVAQVINLDQFYQNNNSMTPYLGQQRPDPFLITDRLDTLHVQWYQFSRSREGSVYGISPGVSFAVLPGLRVGGSATIMTGSSDDSERRVERGRVNIAIGDGKPQNFMVDSIYAYRTSTGTSTYEGTSFMLGVQFEQERYSVGLTVVPPMTVTRTWDREVLSLGNPTQPIQQAGTPQAIGTRESGKDEVSFPLAYTLGVVLKPTDKWMVAFDYSVRNLADVEWATGSGSGTSHPWVSNKGAMRLGAEYRPNDRFAFRGGFREDVQAFAGDGSAIVDQAVRGGVYSFGAGIGIGTMVIDLAYEYSILKYEDIYQSNVNYNRREQHQVMVEVGYHF